ncbi:hypothetical protein ACLB2K_056416 [Fragaria x ananassa]
MHIIQHSFRFDVWRDYLLFIVRSHCTLLSLSPIENSDSLCKPRNKCPWCLHCHPYQNHFKKIILKHHLGEAV